MLEDCAVLNRVMLEFLFSFFLFLFSFFAKLHVHVYVYACSVPLLLSACLALHVLACLAVHFGVENGKES